MGTVTPAITYTVGSPPKTPPREFVRDGLRLLRLPRDECPRSTTPLRRLRPAYDCNQWLRSPLLAVQCILNRTRGGE